MILTHIWKVAILNLTHDTDYLEVLHASPHSRTVGLP